GEPGAAMSERRIKRSPLRDVAGMIRSFHYAAYAGLQQHEQRGSLSGQNLELFESWALLWYRQVSARFLQGYFDTAGQSEVVPASSEERQVMLPAYLLNKALYELGYELNHRPDWIRIPLQGILHLMN